MKKNKLISIILPVYNGEKYLRESIESIINQLYSRFELIIVDDYSSDTSLQIAQEYQLKDSRIKIIKNEENLKLPSSLNRGFKMAQGEYLTWTSDDNIYKQDALVQMIEALEDNLEYDFVYAEMEKIDSENKVIGFTSSRPENVYSYNCIGACFLYRRKCQEQVGEYDYKMFLVEDYDYWIRISQKSKIFHLDQLLYYYRFHEKSLSISKMKQVGKQLLKMKLKYFDYLFEKIDNNERERFLYELLIYDKECLNDKKELTPIVQKVKQLIPEYTLREEDKVYLYGAGSMGKIALKYFESYKIIAFVDRNSIKVGTKLLGYNILSVDKIRDTKFFVIITTDVRNSYDIACTLKNMGIKKYGVFYNVL